MIVGIAGADEQILVILLRGRGVSRAGMGRLRIRWRRPPGRLFMSVTPFPVRQPNQFIDDLLGYMTLSEKLGQLSLDESEDHPAIEAKVASAEIGGVIGSTKARRLQGLAVEHSRLGIPLLIVAKPKVAYSPWALAATWDPHTAQSCGQELGMVTRDTGANTVLGPRLAIAGDAATADDAHLAGAEPYLLAQLGLAFATGAAQSGSSGAGRGIGSIGSISAPGAPERQAICAVHLVSGAISGLDGVNLPFGSPFAGILASECRRIVKLVRRIFVTTTSGTMESAAEKAIANSLVTAEEIDQATRGVLTAKYRLGLFRDPFGIGDAPPRKTALTSAEFARRTMVLLRNEGGLLPLSAVSDRVLVVGSLDGAGARCAEALQRNGIDFMAAPGLALRRSGESWTEPTQHDHLALALTRDAAERADFVLLVLEDRHFERPDHHAWARPSDALMAMVTALSRTNARLVALVATREPVDLGEADRNFAAVLQCWEPTSGFEEALGNILAGQDGPEGRMPVTVGHFPSGHGLGFGECIITGFRLRAGSDHVTATVSGRNAGAFAMKETVQVYIRDSDDTPRLIAFERVFLEPGEELSLRIELGAAAFGDAGSTGRFEIAPGSREVLLGKSLGRLLAAEITITQQLARAMGSGRAIALRSAG